MFYRRTLAIFAFALSTGCGGSNSTSSDSTPGTPVSTTAPAAFATSEAGTQTSGSSHHSRHRRRHHGSGSSGAAIPDVSDAAPSARGTPGGGAYPCDDAKFVSIQSEFASGALEGDQEVDVCGPVTRVLPARTTRSGLHGYYYVRVAPGSTIEIVSDLGRMNAPTWPWVEVGDSSTVRGRYYFDSSSSQGIDWTHHGTSRSWPSAGYVVVNGTQYQ